jgi:hypothetical protein
MRKKVENNVRCAGKAAIPPDENDDFTLGVESQNVSAIVTITLIEVALLPFQL